MISNTRTTAFWQERITYAADRDRLSGGPVPVHPQRRAGTRPVRAAYRAERPYRDSLGLKRRLHTAAHATATRCRDSAATSYTRFPPLFRSFAREQ
jgi:hypothetical protein